MVFPRVLDQAPFQVLLLVRTDKSEYKGGESILITAHVNNKSNKTIKTIRASIQHIRYDLDTTLLIDSFTDHNIQESRQFN